MNQKTALQLLKQGKNVFLTGQAGSGKTYVLNQYTDWLRRHGIDPAITATTGIAATHIGGTTIHSWSGMGIADRLTPQLQDDLLGRESLWKRMKNTDVLVIDEISMLPARLLDYLDYHCRAIRRDDRPFGGIQVISTGDFLQLPPVRINPRFEYDWAFDSEAWNNAERHAGGRPVLPPQAHLPLHQAACAQPRSRTEREAARQDELLAFLNRVYGRAAWQRQTRHRSHDSEGVVIVTEASLPP